MIYYLVVGVTVSAGGYYTYKAFTSKQVRHTEHVTDPKEQTKAELQPLPGETEHVAEAGKACSETGEISVKESDSVDAEEVPEAAAVLPEESQASASEVPAEAALVETSVLSSEPELKITDDHDASRWRPPKVSQNPLRRWRVQRQTRPTFAVRGLMITARRGLRPARRGLRPAKRRLRPARKLKVPLLRTRKRRRVRRMPN